MANVDKFFDDDPWKVLKSKIGSKLNQQYEKKMEQRVCCLQQQRSLQL